MNDLLQGRVLEVFREVLKQPGLLINNTTTADDVEGWDSLTHMSLIAALEEKFSLTFTFDEVSGFNNVGDMIKLISEKTHK